MSGDPSNQPYWQTEYSPTFIAGLKTPGGEIARQMNLDVEDKNGSQLKPGPVFNDRKTELLEKDLINFLGRKREHLNIENNGGTSEPSKIEIGGINLDELNKQLSEEGLGDAVMLATASFVPSNKRGKTNWREKKFSVDTEVELLNNDLKMVNPPLVHELANSKYGFNEEMRNDVPIPPYSLVLEYSKQGTEGARLAEEEFGIDESAIPETTEEAVDKFYNDWDALRDIPDDIKQDGIDVLFYKGLNGCGGDDTSMWDVEGFAEDVIREFDADLYQKEEGAEYGLGILQLMVPHFSDVRTVAAEDEIIQTYERIGPHDKPQTNFDELPEEIKNSPERLVEGNHANPIYHLDNENEIQGIQNLLDDGVGVVDRYLSEHGLTDEAIEENVGVFLGWDFAMVNHKHPMFKAYPEPVKKHLVNEEYAVPTEILEGPEHGFQAEEAGDLDYVFPTVLEANVSPGMKGDRVVDDPRQDTRPNLRSYMDSLSYGREFQTGSYLEE